MSHNAKLSLARAIVDRPDIILFDQPTAGLDPPTARSICGPAIRLRDTEGVTITCAYTGAWLASSVRTGQWRVQGQLLSNYQPWGVVTIWCDPTVQFSLIELDQPV